jgi:hypothetical protein
MATFSRGKYALAISDRSGMAFPYDEMVKEWNGSFVHISEFESKHPQIRRKKKTADKIALQNARPQRFQQPSRKFANDPTQDQTLTDSGGTSVGVANLTLPGSFAFNTEIAPITEVVGSRISSKRGMEPTDPSLENRKREAVVILGDITVNIT